MQKNPCICNTYLPMKNHISVLSMQCCICDIFREFRRCAGCCDEGKENEHVSNRLLFFFPCSLVCLHYLSVIKFCTQPSKICHFNCSSSILFTNLPDQIPPHLCPGLHAGLHCELCRMHVSQARREGLRQVGQMFAGGLAVFSARPLEDLSPVRLAKGLIISSRERNDVSRCQ